MSAVPTADQATADDVLDRSRPVIEFEGVGVEFGDVTALRDVDLTVDVGEFVAVVGPSGCGKSTLLSLVAGLLEPSTGQVRHAGREVRGPNQHVGFVTQKDLLLPWRTVESNIRLPLELRGRKREAEEKVAEVIERVGLQGFAKKYPSQLSGGMRKRVSIARTLVYDPAIYLMDEPFGSLDAQLRTVMHTEVLRLWRETGTTFMFITHDLGEALVLAQRVVVMTRRPGTIRSVQAVEIDKSRYEDAADIQGAPEFQEQFARLWSQLEL